MLLLSRRTLMLISLISVFLLSTLLASFSPMIVRAQSATATWKDAATLIYNNREFRETDIADDDWHFYSTNDQGCREEIKGFTNPGYNANNGPFVEQNVQLHKQRRLESGGCTPDGTDTIRLLAQPQGYNTTFRWIDNMNLETADGKRQFSFNEQTNTFVSITDQSSCKDFIRVGDDRRNIELNIFADTARNDATFRLRDKYGNAQAGTSGYAFYPMINSAGDITINGDACHRANPINTTADATNAGVEGTSRGPDDGAEADRTCEENFAMAFSWFVCGLLGLMDNILGFLQDQVYSLLTIEADQYNNSQLQQVWSYFRNIASFLLIAIGLVMIIGQAVGRD